MTHRFMQKMIKDLTGVEISTRQISKILNGKITSTFAKEVTLPNGNTHALGTVVKAFPRVWGQHIQKRISEQREVKAAFLEG